MNISIIQYCVYKNYYIVICNTLTPRSSASYNRNALNAVKINYCHGNKNCTAMTIL